MSRNYENNFDTNQPRDDLGRWIRVNASYSEIKTKQKGRSYTAFLFSLKGEFMTKSEYDAALTEALKRLRTLSPKNTGNMASNATKLEFEDALDARIYIDPDIAPYSVYTEIPWYETSPVVLFSKKKEWIGNKTSQLYDENKMSGIVIRTPKKNPNEGWFDRAVGSIADFIAAKIGGKVE